MKTAVSIPDQVFEQAERLVKRTRTSRSHTLLAARVSGLPEDSVANASQVVTFDKTARTERVGRLPRAKLDLILAGIDVILGR